jgi:hypothetical protein
MVSAVIASLNVAVTAEVIATPFVEFAGVTEATVGAGPATVVNDQV